MFTTEDSVNGENLRKIILRNAKESKQSNL